MLQENEKWAVGFEGRYAVNTEGEVISYVRKTRRSLVGGIIFDKAIGRETYKMVSIFLNGKQVSKYFHRLVAEAFIPNPENKPCVNHKDGNKLNNRPDNLEWVTFSENNQHAWDEGLIPPKDLTEDVISDRCNNFIAAGTTEGVKKHNVYKYLTEDHFFDHNLPKEMVDLCNTHSSDKPIDIWNHYIDLFRMLERGMKNVDIAKVTGLDYTMISKIKNGHRAQDAKALYDKYGKDPYYLVNYVKQYDY